MYVRIGDVNQGQLVACDNCGYVAMLKAAPQWRVYDPRMQHETFPMKTFHDDIGHHCPSCAEYNELIRGGLVHGVSPLTAVVYESEK